MAEMVAAILDYPRMQLGLPLRTGFVLWLLPGGITGRVRVRTPESSDTRH